MIPPPVLTYLFLIVAAIMLLGAMIVLSVLKDILTRRHVPSAFIDAPNAAEYYQAKLVVYLAAAVVFALFAGATAVLT